MSDNKYSDFKLVARNSRYDLYDCLSTDGGRFLIQIPTDDGVDSVDKNAFFLDKLATSAKEIQSTSETHQYNYHLGFPNLVETIERDGFNCNILNFNGIDDFSSVIPLIKMYKEGFRVDLRTSAWIFGKLLKILSFAHINGIEVFNISGNNVLIHPDLHYVMVFDWSSAQIVKMSPSTVRREIMKAAELIVKILGTDLEKTKECSADDLYVDYICKLLERGHSNATKAHAEFYEIVNQLCSMPDSVWKSGFYKFTTRKVGV